MGTNILEECAASILYTGDTAWHPKRPHFYAHHNENFRFHNPKIYLSLPPEYFHVPDKLEHVLQIFQVL
jgi:hypothetical protein